MHSRLDNLLLLSTCVAYIIINSGAIARSSHHHPASAQSGRANINISNNHNSNNFNNRFPTRAPSGPNGNSRRAPSWPQPLPPFSPLSKVKSHYIGPTPLVGSVMPGSYFPGESVAPPANYSRTNDQQEIPTTTIPTNTTTLTGSTFYHNEHSPTNVSSYNDNSSSSSLAFQVSTINTPTITNMNVNSTEVTYTTAPSIDFVTQQSSPHSSISVSTLESNIDYSSSDDDIDPTQLSTKVVGCQKNCPNKDNVTLTSTAIPSRESTTSSAAWSSTDAHVLNFTPTISSSSTNDTSTYINNNNHNSTDSTTNNAGQNNSDLEKYLIDIKNASNNGTRNKGTLTFPAKQTNHNNNGNNYSQVHPSLIYSIRYEIRSYDLANSAAMRSNNQHTNYAPHTQDHQYQVVKNSKTLIAGLKNTIGLDFYYSESGSYIYWTDVIEERIYRGAIINGTITNVDMIIQTGLATAEGLAVDWIGHNIYWVESTLDHIEVANMNGTSRRTLIAGDLESPRALAVDPRYGLLFWTDWDKKSPRIERATMSGDDRKVIVHIKEHKGAWPNGLTLDYDTLKIYWIDASSDSIHVVDYDGGNHQALLKQIKSLGHPFSITLFEDNLYWTDWKTNSVSMASKHNGSDARELQRLSNRLFDIKVFHPSRQPRIDNSLNPCFINNGNCSHLCLLSANHTRKCHCPHLMKLKQDETTCETDEHVLIIGRTNEIRVVDIDEPLYHIVAPISVPKVFHPRQFEFDAKSRTIFWADSQTNEVKRAQLAGNNIETIIDVIIESPSGLALDWISGNIYVSSSSHQNSSGKIFISNLNGEYISILMDSSQGIISPKSLAVQPMLGFLFYIDETETSEPIIYVARMDGSDRRAIVTKANDPKLENPFNLAVDYDLNRVYWINQASSPKTNASIQYYDILEDKIVTVLDESELPSNERINPTALCIDGNYLIISGRSLTEAIIKQSKHDLNDRIVHKTQNLDQITALKVYNASSQHGTNACSFNNGGCSQLCVPTNETHRACRCTIGYSINRENNSECFGRDLFLIFSYNLGMRGISIEPNSSPDEYYLPPIHRAFRASSLDYVHRDNLIYWVDNEEGSITRINRDTTNYQVIVQGLESEECIGIDWIAGNIYWLDPYYHIIEVARLNGSNRYVIVSGDMDKANGLVVNPIEGYIAWSDIGPTPKIETARLDGSNRRIVAHNLSHIDDLAIDHEDDYIYWVDSTNALVERIKQDGSRRQVIFSGTNYYEPHHFVSIALYKDYLYIADSVYNQGSIIRVNKYNTSDRGLIQQRLGDGIRDIAIFAEQPMPSPSDNPCVLNNGGCQDLCLYLGSKGQQRCICSHGKLKPDGLTCELFDKFILFSKFSQIDSLHINDDESHNNSPYPPIVLESRSNIIAMAVDYNAQRIIYSEITRDQICSILFNGTDRRVLAEKQNLVEGLAFDNDELYWTSIYDNSISRLKTSSLGVLKEDCSSGECKRAAVEKLIRLGPDDKPRGIAVDGCTSYVYWTNWNTDASIQRASPRNGYKVETIIRTNIKIPNGITIDQKQRKLYWCDARLDKIETCDMDGTNRVVLITAASPQHPFAITVSDNYIFYTDWLARGVFRADKYTGQDHKLVKKVSQKPMGIAVVASDSQECLKTHCTINNGDCPNDYTCIQHSPGSGFENDIECRPQNQVTHDLMIPVSRCKLSRAGDCDPTNYRRILMDTMDRYGLSAMQPLVPQLSTPATSRVIDISPARAATTKSLTPDSTNQYTLYGSTKDINQTITLSSSVAPKVPASVNLSTTNGVTDKTQAGQVSVSASNGSGKDEAFSANSKRLQSNMTVPTTNRGSNWTTTTPSDYSVQSSIQSATSVPLSTSSKPSTSKTISYPNATLMGPQVAHVSTDTNLSPSTSPVPLQETTTSLFRADDTIKPTPMATIPTIQSKQQQLTSSFRPQESVTAIFVSSTIAPVVDEVTEATKATTTSCAGSSTTDNNDNDCKAADQFRCFLSKTLLCISNERRCDGNYDCPDKEDENDCTLVKGSVQYNVKNESNWHRFITVILIIFAAAVAGSFLVFGSRGRRRWFLNKNCAFSHRRMFDIDNGTNIEISNPMFDEDDTGNLMHCAYSIDLNERTTNFSNPLYERQVLLMNDKNSTTN